MEQHLLSGQAKLIKKYTDNVIIGYDQDSAGKDATLRAMDILANEGLNVKVLKLDTDKVKDPDEYVTKFGKEKFLKCVNSSVPLVEYKISIFENMLDELDVTSKIKFLNKASEVIGKITNSVEREIYIDRISEKYKISKGAIENEVNKVSKVNSESTVTLRDVTRKAEITTPIRKKMEQHIIELMISKDKAIYKALEENITEDMITSPGVKKLYIFLKDLAKNYDIFKVDILSKIEDEELVKEMTDVMYIDDFDTNKYKLLEDVLKYMKKENLTKRRKEIFEEISKDISNDEKEILQVELSEINKELASLK